MSDDFKIYIDRLRGSKEQEIDIFVSPEFLKTDEAELYFEDKVHIKCRAYIAGNDLILTCDTSALAKMPCKICNVMTDVPIVLKNSYHVIDLEKIKTNIFDFSKLIREEVILALPIVTECKNNCPERKILKKYLK